MTRVIERFHYAPAAAKQTTWDLGNGYHFDPLVRAILKDDQKIELSTSEFNLITYLIRHANRVISRDQILEAVHQRLHDASDRSVDMLVTRLRKKISESDVSIKSIRGAGYMLAGPIAQV